MQFPPLDGDLKTGGWLFSCDNTYKGCTWPLVLLVVGEVKGVFGKGGARLPTVLSAVSCNSEFPFNLLNFEIQIYIKVENVFTIT